MIKAIITPEMWEELEKVLRKHQIGYSVTYDAHGSSIEEMIVAMNPISVQYFKEKELVQIATGVPKAKWEKDGHGHKCSNCGEYANSYEDSYSRDNEFLDQFCSHCGAEMDNWE